MLEYIFCKFIFCQTSESHRKLFVALYECRCYLNINFTSHMLQGKRKKSLWFRDILTKNKPKTYECGCLHFVEYITGNFSFDSPEHIMFYYNTLLTTIITIILQFCNYIPADLHNYFASAKWILFNGSLNIF